MDLLKEIEQPIFGMVCAPSIEQGLRNELKPHEKEILGGGFFSLIPVVIDANMSSKNVEVYRDKKTWRERVNEIEKLKGN